MLFAILDEKTKKKTAFREYKNYTIGQYMTHIEKMKSSVNRPLQEVYDLCKYHLDPTSFDTVIPKVEQPVVLNKNVHEKTTLTLPNCDPSLIMVERLASAIEVAIKCLKENGKKTTLSKAEKIESFFLQGLSYEEIGKKQGVTDEAVRFQICDKFANPLLDGKIIKDGVPEFRFSDEFISELKQLSYDALFSSTKQITNKLGLDVDVKDSIYMPFLNLDVLQDVDNIPFCCFVPKDKIGVYRKALKQIKDNLNKSFAPIREEDLLASIKEITKDNVDKDQYRKLLHNFLKELGTTETLQGGEIWVKDEHLSRKYVRQARIIYKAEGAITKDETASIYKDLYNEEMGNVMSSLLTPLGFSCTGVQWVYGTAIRNARDIIAECVMSHNNIVRFEVIESALEQAGHHYPYRSLRSYITDICVPCNTDDRLFCHKQHVDEHPEYSWRKETDYGQENYVVTSVAKYLSESNGTAPIKTVRSWLKSQMQDNGYNFKNIYTILDKYTKTDKPLFYIHGKDISINKTVLENTDLKTIGLRGASKEYSMSVISLAINELHKRENNEMWLTDLIPMVLSDIAPEPTLSRKKILDILESSWTDDLTVFRNEDGRIGIKLTKEFIPVPIYTVETEQGKTSDLPQMKEIHETREKISSTTVVDWDKLLARLKRELEYYVRPSWFGMDFNLDDALSNFQTLMTSSKNLNLAVIIPQDLYAYWFCAIDEYDRNRYFCDLARCYEALLKDIYYLTRTTPMRKVNGLYELSMLYYPTIYEALESKELGYGFKRVVKDLNAKRNKLAHGDYVELSTVLEAQTIINYIALYVYTIAKNGRI